MNERPKLFDLFCGAGGAAMGYYRAGFDVVGVDAKAQTRYPFRFIRADALEYAQPLMAGSLMLSMPARHAKSIQRSRRNMRSSAMSI